MNVNAIQDTAAAAATDSVRLPQRGCLLKVDNLATSFDTEHGIVRAVDGISFELGETEFLSVVGESGSGKSVLARSIIRLLPKRNTQSSGTVHLDGVELTALCEKELRTLWGPKMAMIFQDPMTALNPVMKIGKQIDEVFKVHTGMSKVGRAAAAAKLMREVGIPEPETRLEQYPHQLSGGMRQRVMIAIALALDPVLLMADEPTTALDVTIQAQVMALLISEQSERRMAVMLITHDLGVAATYSDSIVVVYAGQIVEKARAERLFSATRSPYTEALRNSIPRLENPPHTKLETIAGRPPNMAKLPGCCRFAPRCRYAQDKCLESMPPLLASDDDPDHFYRCFFPTGTAAGAEALARNLSRGASATGLPVLAVDEGSE